MITVDLKKLEEMFPVGSLVRYKRDLSDDSVLHPDNYLDFKFKVKGHMVWFGRLELCLSRFTENNDYILNTYRNWWHFELIPQENNKINNSIICPRCSGEMIKKLTQEYGLIDKCQNCGYC